MAFESGAVDLATFGAPFLAKPHLVERLKRNAPLNDVNRAAFYAGRSPDALRKAER